MSHLEQLRTYSNSAAYRIFRTNRPHPLLCFRYAHGLYRASPSPPTSVMIHTTPYSCCDESRNFGSGSHRTGIIHYYAFDSVRREVRDKYARPNDMRLPGTATGDLRVTDDFVVLGSVYMRTTRPDGARRGEKWRSRVFFSFRW